VRDLGDGESLVMALGGLFDAVPLMELRGSFVDQEVVTVSFVLESHQWKLGHRFIMGSHHSVHCFLSGVEVIHVYFLALHILIYNNPI
jgi:hypothetical protein